MHNNHDPVKPGSKPQSFGIQLVVAAFAELAKSHTKEKQKSCEQNRGLQSPRD